QRWPSVSPRFGVACRPSPRARQRAASHPGGRSALRAAIPPTVESSREFFIRLLSSSRRLKGDRLLRRPMLGRYNAVVIAEALRARRPLPPFPPADDRAAWSAIRNRLGPTETEDILRRALEAADGPLSPLPATLYLEFMRNGAREGYERPARGRRERL